MSQAVITGIELLLLHDKIISSVAGMGVVINKGKVLKHRSDTDLLEKVERERPETICGFYDHAIKIEHLREDLEYMGVQII